MECAVLVPLARSASLRSRGSLRSPAAIGQRVPIGNSDCPIGDRFYQVASQWRLEQGGTERVRIDLFLERLATDRVGTVVEMDRVPQNSLVERHGLRWNSDSTPVF